MHDSSRPADQADPPRPYWIPGNVDFDSLPEELQAAISGIVIPAYNELVLKAGEGLEKSTGLTIVHLLWLEVLDQIELGHQTNIGEDDDNARKQREADISRYLRLIGAKNKASSLLLRLYDFRQKWGALTPSPEPLRTSSFPK